jgi:hypothetical protein
VALQSRHLKERRCTALKADERVSPLHKNFHSLSYKTTIAGFDEQKRLNITPQKRCRGGDSETNASSVKAGKKAGSDGKYLF